MVADITGALRQFVYCHLSVQAWDYGFIITIDWQDRMTRSFSVICQLCSGKIKWHIQWLGHLCFIDKVIRVSHGCLRATLTVGWTTTLSFYYFYRGPQMASHVTRLMMKLTHDRPSFSSTQMQRYMSIAFNVCDFPHTALQWLQGIQNVHFLLGHLFKFNGKSNSKSEQRLKRSSNLAERVDNRNATQLTLATSTREISTDCSEEPC